jgi:hypothetical protein
VNRAAIAEQHLVGLLGVDHGDDQQLAALGQAAAASACADAPCSRAIASRRPCRDAHRLPEVEQAQRHAQAHVADADDADRPSSRRSALHQRRLLATDIRMPSPGPA